LGLSLQTDIKQNVPKKFANKKIAILIKLLRLLMGVFFKKIKVAS